jgi:hypothetical protein
MSKLNMSNKSFWIKKIAKRMVNLTESKRKIKITNIIINKILLKYLTYQNLVLTKITAQKSTYN